VELLEAAHRADIRIIMDLVLNHTSDAHPWFQAARADRNSPTAIITSGATPIRNTRMRASSSLDTEESNWTWDEQAGQYYWHRFYASQPDLNYDNPRCRRKCSMSCSFWLDLGVDGFRADAVPYLFEREGTNCENLPETHAYLKRLRAFMDEIIPGASCCAKQTSGPRMCVPILGTAMSSTWDFTSRSCRAFSWHSKRDDAEDMVWILNRTPPIPENCQWCIFLRNHDELTLEMVTTEGAPVDVEQYAPDPRMRLNLGIRRRLAPLLDNDRRKIWNWRIPCCSPCPARRSSIMAMRSAWEITSGWRIGTASAPPCNGTAAGRPRGTSDGGPYPHSA
jgi:maltose alpha-D-glucosyltransferase / alpha-amylase